MHNIKMTLLILTSTTLVLAGLILWGLISAFRSVVPL